MILALYALLFGWTAFGPRLRGWTAAKLGETDPRLAQMILARLGLFTVVAWRLALAAPDGRQYLTMLDVGGGDALLIQTPAGRNLLINSGRSPNALSDSLGRRRVQRLAVASIKAR